ncbi:MAG TPA: alpha/beta fold hydrolase [Pseudomonadales bacterium]|nr:alpha/beta fold hydrolase [Pseudomonadales bacterium]
MARVRVRDIEIEYEIVGEGPPVLFISGTGGDLRVRPNVLDAPVAARTRLLAYDQRGLGRTTVPDGAATMADYADDAAALLDALAFAPVAVVGVSFGGMVAQELALRHAHRVSRLLLCCTSSGGDGGASYPLHELAQLEEGERFARQLAISDVRMDAAWQAANPGRVAQLEAQMRAARAVGEHEAGRARGAALQLEARRHHDTYDRLPRLAIPVLIAGGRHDGLAPPENQRVLAERIPGARLRMYEGGHLFLVQDRTAWPELTDWLLEGAD